MHGCMTVLLLGGLGMYFWDAHGHQIGSAVIGLLAWAALARGASAFQRWAGMMAERDYRRRHPDECPPGF